MSATLGAQQGTPGLCLRFARVAHTWELVALEDAVVVPGTSKNPWLSDVVTSEHHKVA